MQHQIVKPYRQTFRIYEYYTSWQVRGVRIPMGAALRVGERGNNFTAQSFHKGKGTVCQAGTRWKALFHAVERIWPLRDSYSCCSNDLTFWLSSGVGHFWDRRSRIRESMNGERERILGGKAVNEYLILLGRCVINDIQKREIMMNRQTGFFFLLLNFFFET